MKKFKMTQIEVSAIIKSAALYNLAGMHNIDNEFDDDCTLLLLSIADEFSYIGTCEAQFETAMDQFEYLSQDLKSRVKEIETLILKTIKPQELNAQELNAQELNFLVNNFLNSLVAA